MKIVRIFSALVATGILWTAGGAWGDEHVVGPGGAGSGAVTPSSFDKRIEDAAMGYAQKYPGASIARIVLIDTALPLNKSEYEALGKNGIVLFSALSHDETELPLSATYLGGVKLKCIGSIRRQSAPQSPAWIVFGPYRVDSFCLLPVDLMRKDPTLSADFAKNRVGFLISQDRIEEPDFMVADANPVSNSPALSAVRTLIEREYPGFGIEPSQ